MEANGKAFCINVEPGTFGHECGKPAVAIGQTLDGKEFCFCEDCRWNGHEGRKMERWWDIPTSATAAEAPADPYAGHTAEVSDHVMWTDPKDGHEFDDLEVKRVWPKERQLTVHGHFGRGNWQDRNKAGDPILRTRRLPMAECQVMRRSS